MPNFLQNRPTNLIKSSEIQQGLQANLSFYRTIVIDMENGNYEILCKKNQNHDRLRQWSA